MAKIYYASHTRNHMHATLKNIQNGSFARTWLPENQAGSPTLHVQRQKDAQHLIEAVREPLRQILS